MSAQTYDFLDSSTHEITAQVKVSFTKLGQSESSSSEDEDDEDPTAKNRTWTECCIDCLGYCGLETLLWVFLVLLYLCFIITFLLCVVFSIVTTVMFLFDKLCASDSTIIAVLDELSSTLSEFGISVIDDRYVESQEPQDPTCNPRPTPHAPRPTPRALALNLLFQLLLCAHVCALCSAHLTPLAIYPLLSPPLVLVPSKPRRHNH